MLSMALCPLKPTLSNILHHIHSLNNQVGYLLSIVCLGLQGISKEMLSLVLCLPPSILLVLKLQESLEYLRILLKHHKANGLQVIGLLHMLGLDHHIFRKMKIVYVGHGILIGFYLLVSLSILACHHISLTITNIIKVNNNNNINNNIKNASKLLSWLKGNNDSSWEESHFHYVSISILLSILWKSFLFANHPEQALLILSKVSSYLLL